MTLAEFIDAYYPKDLAAVLKLSALMGSATVCWPQEVQPDPSAPPILLATHIDGQPLTREAGLVRLIVPAERDDALRQVKWIAEIRIITDQKPEALIYGKTAVIAFCE